MTKRGQGGKLTSLSAESPRRRRMTVGVAEKSQQCHKYFVNTVHWLPKDLRFERVGAKLASCPRRHL